MDRVIRVVRVIGADPELAMQVLRPVNSSAVAARRRVDSVRQAATMLDAQGHSSAGRRFVLTRALTCRAISRSDAGYTVGLLSAAASQLAVEPADLVARAGVSQDVGDAVRTLRVLHGPALAAVLAHEENDFSEVEATGLASFIVANAYLTAVAAARTQASSLAG